VLFSEFKVGSQLGIAMSDEGRGDSWRSGRLRMALDSCFGHEDQTAELSSGWVPPTIRWRLDRCPAATTLWEVSSSAEGPCCTSLGAQKTVRRCGLWIS
jgi:hypothetical protein